MKIYAQDIGKIFNNRWIFRHLHINLRHCESLAITGRNGSGKSTLLKLLITALTPSEGQINIDPAIYNPNSTNYCGPDLELIEEFTLREHLDFHSHFSTPLFSLDSIVDKIGLEKAAHIPLQQFSSGMKQRTKLALCFYFESQILALDEPTSHLDFEGTQWFFSELKKSLHKRTLIIASNQKKEYEICNQNICLDTQN